MPLVQSKQVQKFITGRIYVPAAASVVAGNVSANVTATLTAALATASDQGTAVPLQAHIANTQMGLLVTAPKNLVEVYDANGVKLQSADGDEIYGRLTQAGAVFTVAFYSLAAGVETAYAFDAAETIDIVVPYVFDFVSLPTDFATSLKTAYVNDDPIGAPRTKTEVVAVTALNTLDVTSENFNGAFCELNVNGQIIDIIDPAAPFAFAAGSNAIAWSQLNAGYPLETTDTVIVTYSY